MTIRPRESPDAKSRGGGPPPPRFRGRSFPLARFGDCAALFRSWGYSVTHLRTLIWGAFSGRAAQPRGFPLGGKLSPKVTDEGATGLPNGAREKFRWGDRREPPLFYKERLGTGSPSHPPQCAHWGTFPPRGRLWGWEGPVPSEKPPLPARPAGGRAVTGVRYRAAGQAEKRGPLTGSSKPE